MTIHYFVLISDQSNRSNLSSAQENQCISYIMSSTTITRQCARSSLNVELIDYSELDTVVKANKGKNSANRKEKAAEKRPQAALTLGQVA